MKKFIVYFVVAFVAIVFFASCSKKETKVSKEENLIAFEQKIEKIVKDMGLKRVEKLETRSDDECQDHNIIFCEGPFEETYTVFYGGCPFEVTGEVSFCSDLITGNTYMLMGEVTGANDQAFLDGHCMDIMTDWLDLWHQGKKEELADSIDTWKYALEQAWERNFVEQYILKNPSGAYYCTNPNIDLNVIVDNYKGVCYQKCISYDSDRGLSWKDIRCGFGCCKRTTDYCVDPTTNQLVSNTTIEVITECSYDDPEPYPGCMYLSECRETCSKIR